MIVEAIKKDDGFYIPFTDELSKVKADRVLLKVEILNETKEIDYSALDQIIGFCETKVNEASIKHDEIIYGKRK